MSNEEMAREVGNTPRLLKQRLLDAHDCLRDENKKIFSQKRIDYKEKRMISDNGDYALQWMLRSHPDWPESLGNQQTNRGTIRVVCLR